MAKVNKTSVTLSLRTDLWAKYQQYCKDNDLIPSYEIQKFMAQALK